MIEDVVAVSIVTLVIGYSLTAYYSYFAGDVGSYALSSQVERAWNLLHHITSEGGHPANWGDIASDPESFGLAKDELYVLDAAKCLRLNEHHPSHVSYATVKDELNVKSLYFAVRFPLSVRNVTDVGSGRLRLWVTREGRDVEGTARFYVENPSRDGFDVTSVPIVEGRCELDVEPDCRVLAVVASSKYAGLKGMWLYNSTAWWGGEGGRGGCEGWGIANSYIANGALYLDTHGERAGHEVAVHVVTYAASYSEIMVEVGNGKFKTECTPLRTDVPSVVFYYDATQGERGKWLGAWVYPTPVTFGHRKEDQVLVRSSARILGELVDVELCVGY